MEDIIDRAIETLSEILLNDYARGNAKKSSILGAGDNVKELNIDTKIMRSCGFDVDEPNGRLFNLYCPRLKREGFLEGFSGVSHPLGDLSGEHKYVSFFINPKKLEEKLKENKKEIKVKISLNNGKIEFDDNSATIKIGETSIVLPPFKNEHSLCRAMFEHLKGEPVDWSIVYERMEDIEPRNKIKDRKKIYDTVEALNSRVKKLLDTEDNFIILKENTLIRNY